jgi:hypothetical protein
MVFECVKSMAAISSVYIAEREPFIKFDNESGLYEVMLTEKAKGVDRIFYPGGSIPDDERIVNIIDAFKWKINIFGGKSIADLHYDLDKVTTNGATHIKVDSYEDDGAWHNTFTAIRSRTETLEEYNLRQNYILELKTELEKNRRAAYEALKAEFE